MSKMTKFKKVGIIKESDLAFIEGQTVNVWINVAGERHTFETGFSICGTLELKGNSCRVVKDDGNYVYFNLSDISSVLQHPTQFKDGSKYSINLDFLPKPMIYTDTE